MRPNPTRSAHALAVGVDAAALEEARDDDNPRDFMRPCIFRWRLSIQNKQGA
jgi:hypothetical protein